MADVDDRFRTLDSLPAPSAWPDLDSVVERPDAPPRAGRALAAIVALAVAIAGMGLAWKAFTDRSESLQVSGRATDLPLECTARLPAAAVEPGASVPIAFTYRNVGKSAMAFPSLSPSVAIRDDGGTILYDTAAGAIQQTSGGRSELRPGEAVSVTSGFRAIWGGTLTISARCGYQVPAASGSEPVSRGIALPPMAIDVFGHSRAPSKDAALGRALAAAHGLFDHCRPASDGASAVGAIEAPAGYSAANVAVGRSAIPALRATCRAAIRSYPGFATVDLMFASPPAVSLPTTREEGVTRGLALPRRVPGAQVGRWTFLVTATGAREVSPVLFPAGVQAPAGPAAMVEQPACAKTRPVPRCAGLTFRVERGRWLATWYRPDWFPGGITFFLSPPADTSAEVTLAEGDWLGKHWVLSVMYDGLVVRSGIAYGDGSSSLTDFSSVPTTCAAKGPAANDFDPETDMGFAAYGAVRHDVARVVVVLKHGKTVPATIYPIPDSFGIAFDQYLAFGKGPIADIDTIRLYDDQGQEIHVDRGCLNP
jgi:hypothetical protein